MTPNDRDMVCCCGSTNIRMLAKHGYAECLDCGEEGYAMPYEDWLTGQEDHHQIPDGYAEQ